MSRTAVGSRGGCGIIHVGVTFQWCGTVRGAVRRMHSFWAPREVCGQKAKMAEEVRARECEGKGVVITQKGEEGQGWGQGESESAAKASLLPLRGGWKCVSRWEWVAIWRCRGLRVWMGEGVEQGAWNGLCCRKRRECWREWASWSWLGRGREHTFACLLIRRSRDCIRLCQPARSLTSSIWVCIDPAALALCRAYSLLSQPNLFWESTLGNPLDTHSSSSFCPRMLIGCDPLLGW